MEYPDNGNNGCTKQRMKTNKTKLKAQHKAKIKKMFVSRTRPTVRKRCDSNIFLRDLRQLFFLVTGNCDQKFRYCSRIYVWNWFTLLNEQNLLLNFEGTRFVNEKKNIYPPTYRPIGEMEGWMWETNIFLRVARHRKLKK